MDPFETPGTGASTPEPAREDAPEQAPRPGGAARSAGRAVAAVLLGAGVAALGTATHRTLWGELPVGLVVALALTVAAAILARSWGGLVTLAAAGVGWIIALQVLTAPGAGGDVLVVDPRAAIRVAWASVAWSWAGIALFGVVAFLPARWFARR